MIKHMSVGPRPTHMRAMWELWSTCYSPHWRQYDYVTAILAWACNPLHRITFIIFNKQVHKRMGISVLLHSIMLGRLRHNL